MKESEYEYKVGDRVRLLIDNPYGNYALFAGDEGVIVGSELDDDQQSLFVDWLRDVRGHDCGGLCEYGHGWNLCRNEVELVIPEPDFDFDNSSLVELLNW